MEKQVKQRLTGAIILVAAVVLLVPELLTGPGRRSGAPSGETTTSEPADAPPMRSLTIDLANPDSGARSAQPRVIEPPTARLPDRADEATSAPPAAEQPAQPAAAASGRQAQEVEKQAAREQARDAQEPAATVQQGGARTEQTARPTAVAQKDPSQQQTATTQRTATTARQESASGGQKSSPAPTAGWAVQVGSFASRENAERLKRDLGGQGFEAFVAEGSSGGRKLYRVRIGPVAERAQAEALAARLRKAGRSGAVVAHP